MVRISTLVLLLACVLSCAYAADAGRNLPAPRHWRWSALWRRGDNSDCSEGE